MSPESRRADDLVLEGLEQIVGPKAGGERADRVLDRLLRAHRDLTSAERAAVARRVLAVACLQGRLRYLVRTAAGPGLDGDPRWLLASYLVTEEAMDPGRAAQAAGVVGRPDGGDEPGGERPEARALRALAATPPAWPAGPVERLAAERSLPEWLARLWWREFGPEADALAESMNRPGPIGVRVNRLRTTREGLVEALGREGIEAVPMRLSPDGLELRGRPNIFGSTCWREGAFEVQDEGSQLIARLAAPPPSAAPEMRRVVDFCAGAGGKTLALASLMDDRGAIVALDVDARRLADLRPRLARAGVHCVLPHRIAPEAGPLPAEAAEADVVLVDAPCSSLGTLRRGPDARWRIAEAELERFPPLQRAILERASSCVRPGGRLVYATCTLARAENEVVAEGFERAHPEYERVPVSALLGDSIARAVGGERGAMTLLPNRHGCDGFFACAWLKR